MARILNLILLVGGYGLGQGALFLAQTWLVGRGELAQMAEFGLNFYLVTLFILIVDFGSTSFLAREVAHSTDKARENGREMWSSFWTMVPIRLTVAIVGFVGMNLYAVTIEGFGAGYLRFAAPGLLIWALNLTGVLDGLRMSGASGISAAIPFVFSAVALAISPFLAPALAGAVAGASLTVGYVGCVAAQLGALLLSGRRPVFTRPTRAALADAFVHSGGAMMTLLPGQIYFRFQLFLCGLLLPAAGTALFLYAKQIVAACAQLIGFLRRVEFPELVKALASPGAQRVQTIMSAQRVGTAVAVVATIVTAAGGLAFYVMGEAERAGAGLAALVFAPTILTSAMALSFVQGLMASRFFQSAAGVMLASTAIAALVSLCLICPLHITGLALADVAGNLITIALAFAVLRRRGAAKAKSLCVS